MIVSTRIAGPSLEGNLLGVASERDLFVYLPPGYEDSERRFATAYLLHADGWSAQLVVRPAVDEARWHPPLEDVLDPVFTRMGTVPMIVVVPDGVSRWGCGQWVDSPVSGNFESYVVRDVVEYVDRHFRTIAQPASRGVFGFSSGGLGSWNIGSRHPETFGALAMLSGDSMFENLRHVVYDYYNSIWPEAPSGPSDEIPLSKMVYSYSATYSPNVERPPFYVDLPVDFASGELLGDVWSRWLRFDPVENWRRRQDGLRQMRGIRLDVGVRDDYGFQWGHRLLSHRLREANIAHEATENAGNHGGRADERHQMALQWLSTVLVHDSRSTS